MKDYERFHRVLTGRKSHLFRLRPPHYRIRLKAFMPVTIGLKVMLHSISNALSKGMRSSLLPPPLVRVLPVPGTTLGHCVEILPLASRSPFRRDHVLATIPLRVAEAQNILRWLRVMKIFRMATDRLMKMNVMLMMTCGALPAVAMV